LQRHEILDRLPAPSKRSAGEHLMERRGSPRWLPRKRQVLRTERPQKFDGAGVLAAARRAAKA
jgi:hypothetical protein